MKTIRNIWQRSKAMLASKYEEREIQQMLSIVFEKATGFSKMQQHINFDEILDDHTTAKIDAYIKRVSNGEPLQYVLEEAYFYKRFFYVNKNVLIPRPETEELVDWILSDQFFDVNERQILDIGTGSGCIAITLSLEGKNLKVDAIDVDDGAVKVAEMNSEKLNAGVHFIEADILDPRGYTPDYKYDLIVSNPPYITSRDIGYMSESTKNHEPDLALFADENDPLQFYEAIADFAFVYLKPSGLLYFELSEFNADETATMLTEKGFSGVSLKKDLQGKNRMLKCTR